MGYTGGTTPNPTYESIGDHTEAIRVTFDPKLLTLDDLYNSFWKQHQPMPLAMCGSQYQSALYCHSDTQMAAAERVKASLVGDSPFSSPVENTVLEKAGDFYRAEEYHQRFIEKQRNAW